MPPIPDDKTAWRRWGTAARNALAPAQRDADAAAITRRVLDLPELRDARSVCCYVSMGAEVATRPLLMQLLERGVELSVPVLRGDLMLAARLDSLSDLVPSTFGVEQPARTVAPDTPPGVILTPGVAFGRRGQRIGRGAGHYDRFFARHPAALAVALLFDEQLAPPDAPLPVEPHDRPMDLLITPTATICSTV